MRVRVAMRPPGGRDDGVAMGNRDGGDRAMVTSRFSSREAVRFGWAMAKRHIGFFVIFLIVVVLISAVPQLLDRLLRDSVGLRGLVVVVTTIIAQVITGVGTIRVGLKFADGARGELRDLSTDTSLFYRYFVGTLLYALIVVGGIVLLIVPGLIWAYKYLFTEFLIVDKGLRPVEALRQSAAMTQGVKMDLGGFSLLLIGINVLGALALLVGLFWTLPASMVATAYVYRQLQRVPATPSV